MAEKGRKRPISADFQEGRPDTPQSPHLLHPHLRQPKKRLLVAVSFGFCTCAAAKVAGIFLMGHIVRQNKYHLGHLFQSFFCF